MCLSLSPSCEDTCCTDIPPWLRDSCRDETGVVQQKGTTLHNALHKYIVCSEEASDQVKVNTGKKKVVFQISNSTLNAALVAKGKIGNHPKKILRWVVLDPFLRSDYAVRMRAVAVISTSAKAMSKPTA